MTDDFDVVMGKDRIPVERDGEELTVFNHVSVEQSHYINSVNGYDSFTVRVYAGDSVGGDGPSYVTKRVAMVLHDEFGIDLFGGTHPQGIDVIDVTDDDVTIL